MFIAVYSPTGQVHLLQDGLITLSGITNCLTADRVVIQTYEELSDFSVWVKFPLTNSCKLRKSPIPHTLNKVTHLKFLLLKSTTSHVSNSSHLPHIYLIKATLTLRLSNLDVSLGQKHFIRCNGIVECGDMSDEVECSVKGGKILHTFRLKCSARGDKIVDFLYIFIWVALLKGG